MHMQITVCFLLDPLLWSVAKQSQSLGFYYYLTCQGLKPLALAHLPVHLHQMPSHTKRLSYRAGMIVIQLGGQPELQVTNEPAGSPAVRLQLFLATTATVSFRPVAQLMR